VCRRDDEVSDEEAGDKMMSVVDDPSSDECFVAEHSSEFASFTTDVTNYQLFNCMND